MNVAQLIRYWKPVGPGRLVAKLTHSNWRTRSSIVLPNWLSHITRSASHFHWDPLRPSHQHEDGVCCDWKRWNYLRHTFSSLTLMQRGKTLFFVDGLAFAWPAEPQVSDLVRWRLELELWLAADTYFLSYIQRNRNEMSVQQSDMIDIWSKREVPELRSSISRASAPKADTRSMNYRSFPSTQTGKAMFRFHHRCIQRIEACFLFGSSFLGVPRVRPRQQFLMFAKKVRTSKSALSVRVVGFSRMFRCDFAL